MAAPSQSPSPPRSAEVQLDRGLRKDVSKLSLLFTGVGSIIGSGWLFGALYASQIAGPAAIFSWIIGGIMFIVIGLAYAELGVMFPVAGGIIRFPNYAFGSFTAYSAGWISWLAAASVAPIEVLATAQYASPYLPWLGSSQEGVFVLSTPWGYIAGVVLMFLYSLINILGVKAFARFNNVLVWYKLAVIILVVLAFFAASFNPGNLTNLGGFAPEGWGAVFVAIPLGGVAFAYLGFRQGVEFAGETDNPQKNVPFAIIGSIVITMLIYVALQVAFLTALPEGIATADWGSLSFADDAGPLAGLASILGILSLGGISLVALMLYIDAVVSPADTGLIYAGVTARLSYANARNDNAPQWLARLNNRGVPWLSVVLMFVVGCIYFLPFPGWQQMVGFVILATVVSFGSGPLVVGALRRQLPDQARPFKLPGGDTIPVLAFVSTNLLVLWTGWDVTWKTLVAIALGYIVLAAYTAMQGSSNMPPWEFKAGSWIVPWFLGLGLVTYLSPYEGGSGALSAAWSALAAVVLSVVIYVWAMAVRLPPQRAAQNIERTPTDAPESV